jgi:phage shock protein C
VDERLYRSRDERLVAGVCGGLAVRFDVDPSIVRVVWVLLALLTGGLPFLVLYVVMVIVVPEEPPGILESMDVHPPEGTPAATAWTAAQAAERAARRSARRAERARGGDRTLVALVGIGLISIGCVLLVERWLQVDWAVIWPAAIIAIGVLVIAGALRR